MHEKAIEAALHEARIYGIGATSDHNQKIILEAATRFAALPPLRAREEIAQIIYSYPGFAGNLAKAQGMADAILSRTAGQECETLPSHSALLAEINKAAHANGTNAWVRDVLQRAHRAIRNSAPPVAEPIIAEKSEVKS